VTNRSLPHACAVPLHTSDSVRVAPVPNTAPTVFASAFVARAPIGELDQEITSCVGYEALHEEEKVWVSAHAPRRVREFVAGRTALRAALREAGADVSGPLLPGEQGRPDLPRGFTGSITHKDGQALAIGRRLLGARTLGIDSEVLGTRDRSSIARRVLTDIERARWEPECSWPALLQTFSLKEAIYKALHPHVPRYIGFDEAEIATDGRITMTLREGEGRFVLIGWSWWEGEPGPSRRLVSICEARPA